MQSAMKMKSVMFGKMIGLYLAATGQSDGTLAPSRRFPVQSILGPQPQRQSDAELEPVTTQQGLYWLGGVALETPPDG